MGEPGRTNLRSLTDTEPDLGAALGLAAPWWLAEGQGYADGSAPMFAAVPYALRGVQRLLAGCVTRFDMGACLGVCDAVWDASSALPLWVDGVLLVRWLDGQVDYLDVPAASVRSGWADDGSGWTNFADAPGVMFDYSDPPLVAPYLWVGNSFWTHQETVLVMPSPLGGWAVDTSLGGALVRAPAEPLMRAGDLTLAFWFGPTDDTGYMDIAGVRGVWVRRLVVNFSLSSGQATFWSHLTGTPSVTLTGHQSGDWYLVVMRLDALLDRLSLPIWKSALQQVGKPALRRVQGIPPHFEFVAHSGASGTARTAFPWLTRNGPVIRACAWAGGFAGFGLQAGGACRKSDFGPAPASALPARSAKP